MKKMEMNKKVMFLVVTSLIVVMVASISFIGCKTTTTETTAADVTTAAVTTAAAGEKKFVKKDPVIMGYSVMNMQQPYWQAYAKGIEDACKESSYEFQLSDQKSSPQILVSGSIDLINLGISALINSPCQPSALPAVIDAAHKAKIPVIVGDVGYAGDYDAYIVSDNYQVGVTAAEYMIKQLSSKSGTKEILVIDVPPGEVAGEQRSSGFRDKLKDNPDFKLVAELTGAGTVDGGFTVTNDVMASNPNLAGIYCVNDPMAEGASQALKAAGKSGSKDIIVVGTNGDPRAFELIKSGEIAATLRQDPYGQGKACVETATTLMNGGSVKFSDEANRTILFICTLVDISNVDQYIGK